MIKPLNFIPCMNCDQNNPQCWSDEKRQRHQFMTLKRFLRKELRRFQLTHRQQTIAETIVELSLGWGNRSVVVPKLDLFTELTGISKANVHGALKSLHDMRIITAELHKGLATYTINLNPETWQCAPRLSRHRIKSALEILKPFNNIKEDEDPEVTTAREEVNKTLTATKQTNGNGHDPVAALDDPAEETPENFKVGPNTQFLWQSVFDLKTVIPDFPSEIC